MEKRIIIGTLLFFIISSSSLAQIFTKKDSLRGTLSPERIWFDITYYHLNIDVNPEQKFISGYNDLHFNVLNSFSRMQLDLFENMVIDSIIYQGENIPFTRLFNAFFIDFPRLLNEGSKEMLRVYYHGIPVEAKNAPWDGGFVWEEDSLGLPWIGVACQGIGASSWWPCKDHLSDEPDSIRVTCSVPESIRFVGNGNLENDYNENGKRVSTWKVSYPINLYNVTLNIADYSHLYDQYISHGDTLSLDYYVLKGNEDKAKKQFAQVKPMLHVYEDLFGAYPFWEDGYALVEAPYLGMEHQSAIAYGNKYMPGYLGKYPGVMDFDFIIIHESGHEYWGNSISMNDISDMWIHESFCTYAEALYVEKIYGYNAMLDYLDYQRKFISGGSPILGYRDVNYKVPGTDMYYKGTWMLHSIRNTIDNDSLWFSIIKEVATEFAFHNCDGVELIEFISKKSSTDLSFIFQQYLSCSKLPILRYKIKKKKRDLYFYYKWDAKVSNFNMPVHIIDPDGREHRIFPSFKYKVLQLENVGKNPIKFVENLFLYEKKQD